MEVVSRFTFIALARAISSVLNSLVVMPDHGENSTMKKDRKNKIIIRSKSKIKYERIKFR